MTTHQDTLKAAGLEIGDGTNRFLVSSTGVVTLEGNATVWDDIRISIAAIKAQGTNDPDFTQIATDGAGSTGVYGFLFDKTVEQEMFFTVELPHEWRAGTDIKPYAVWAPVDTGSGNVVWGLEYIWANTGVAIGNTTLVTVTDAADETAYKVQSAAFADISGTGKTASGVLLCRVYRDAGAAGDTYDNDALLIELDFYYEINKLGKDTEPT